MDHSFFRRSDCFIFHQVEVTPQLWIRVIFLSWSVYVLGGSILVLYLIFYVLWFVLNCLAFIVQIFTLVVGFLFGIMLIGFDNNYTIDLLAFIEIAKICIFESTMILKIKPVPIYVWFFVPSPWSILALLGLVCDAFVYYYFFLPILIHSSILLFSFLALSILHFFTFLHRLALSLFFMPVWLIFIGFVWGFVWLMSTRLIIRLILGARLPALILLLLGSQYQIPDLRIPFKVRILPCSWGFKGWISSHLYCFFWKIKSCNFLSFRELFAHPVAYLFL